MSRDRRPSRRAKQAPVASRAVPDEPLASLPDDITLTRDEAAEVLFALDVIEDADPEPDQQAKVRRAVRLLTAKLWPDLGDLLDEDDGE